MGAFFCMPSNTLILDKKPVNIRIVDVKPLNARIDNLKGTEQLYTRTIAAGQSMGLLLALTYTTGFTVTSSRT